VDEEGLSGVSLGGTGGLVSEKGFARTSGRMGVYCRRGCLAKLGEDALGANFGRERWELEAESSYFLQLGERGGQ